MFSGITNSFSNATLADGLACVRNASHSMLNDPDLEEMQKELSVQPLHDIV